MTWQLDAACIGLPTEMFYRETSNEYAEPRRVCRRCDVAAACLTAAFAEESDHTGRYGMRGGMTPKERAKLHAGAAPSKPTNLPRAKQGHEVSAERQRAARTEWVSDVEYMIAAGTTGPALVAALGVGARAVMQRLYRAGRPDLTRAGGLHRLVHAERAS